MTYGINDVSTTQPVGSRKVIHATCSLHRGPVGFTNLAVSRHEGRIKFDPHVTGSCVITLDEAGARMLFETLGEWLGVRLSTADAIAVAEAILARAR